MANIIFRCPNTGINVQHRLDDVAPRSEENTYDAVHCSACTRLHFINRSTGKLLGDKQARPLIGQ
jgi:hypothetical protein